MSLEVSLDLWEPCWDCEGRGWTVVQKQGQLPKTSWCLCCDKTGRVPSANGERILRFLAEMEGRK